MPTAPGADKTELAPFGMLPESQMEEGKDLGSHTHNTHSFIKLRLLSPSGDLGIGLV